MLLDWNDEKNKWLMTHRRISFEDVELAIEEHRVIWEAEHPNQSKYPHQGCLVVEIENYMYYVPYVIKKNVFFLKTIIPSRNLTKKYLLK